MGEHRKGAGRPSNGRLQDTYTGVRTFSIFQGMPVEKVEETKTLVEDDSPWKEIPSPTKTRKIDARHTEFPGLTTVIKPRHNIWCYNF